MNANDAAGRRTHRRRQLFPGERWVMCGLLAMGLVSTSLTRDWLGVCWCLTCAIWWRYACALEDRLDDVGA